jgi:heptosyltransferase-2
MPNWLGDLVMSTPVLASLRSRWPKARITAMCQSNVSGLLKNDPNIDELYTFHRISGWVGHLQHGEIIDALEHGKYDLGILLTNSFSSAWWFWRGNVQNRIGYAGNLRNWLLTKAVSLPTDLEQQHMILTYKLLLKPLGIEPSDVIPYLVVAPEESAAAWEIYQRYGVVQGKNSLIGVNPGAAFGSAKCWLPDRFRSITELLLEDPNNYIVYFGDAAGSPLVNEICKDLPNRVINLAGKTNLRELLALIQGCNVLLTNDSGPMHIASALKVPLLALFGSTSDVRTGPYGVHKTLHKHVECSPCYKRVCPIDFRCMTRIEVDEVYRELQQLLKQSHPQIWKLK